MTTSEIVISIVVGVLLVYSVIITKTIINLINIVVSMSDDLDECCEKLECGNYKY